MDDSILNTIKKLIGLAPEDTSFDEDIITHINSSIDVLRQLGINSDVYVEDDSLTWGEYLPSSKYFQMVKNYIYMKVRKWFDPPQNGTTMDALSSSIAELEWRINVTVDPSQELIDV